MTRIASAGPRAWALFFAALALLVRLPLSFGRHEVLAGTDSAYYLVLANHLLNGRGFPGEHFYTPGYPAFMAALEALPGRREDAITIGQHLIGVAVVVAVLLVAWRYFGRAPALLAATLAAITPVMVVQEHVLFPDFLFGVVVLAGAIALAEAVRRERPSIPLLVTAGVLFGLATYVKGSGQFLVVAAPFALVFATRDLRATLKGSAVVAAALVLTIAPWILRNEAQFGYPSMSNQGGMTLFNRVFDVDRQLVPTDAEHGRFVRDVQVRTLAEDPTARTVFPVREALIHERGLTSDEAIEVELRLARAGIADHPFTYVKGTFRQVGRLMKDMNRFEGSGEVREELDRTDPPVPSSLTTAAWEAARPLASAWWLLSLNGVAGLLMLFFGTRRSRNAAAALISVWLAIAFGTAMAHGGLWRYSVQLAPITWMLGSAGLAILVSSVVARVRERTVPRDEARGDATNGSPATAVDGQADRSTKGAPKL
jgi:4-amino-4-deoxy-L-arabinose transferase-like glycosyltransferase